MGKRYYCNYCDKTMVATPSMVKTHNSGLVHQKLVQEHYQQFKDPETILSEESRKKPCSRFPNGECQFGSICRYSHYTREHIDALRQYVASKNAAKDVQFPSFEELFDNLQNEKFNTQDIKNGETIMIDSNGVTHYFPWSYNTLLDGYSDLPPSVKRMKIEDFEDAEINSWG